MIVRLFVAEKGDRTWWIKDQQGRKNHLLLAFMRTTNELNTAIIYGIIVGPFAMVFTFLPSNPQISRDGGMEAK